MAKAEKAAKAVKYIPRAERAQAVKALVTKKKYSVEEAMALLPQLSLSRFVGSANLDVILRLKEKQANESVRGSIVFPNQFGAEKKVLVLAEGEKVKEAEKAGADFAGLDEYVKKIEDGWFDFDVVIAQPSVMMKIAKLGKVLGPKQLMPNPKTGTVTESIGAAVKMYKAGKLDFKMDAGKTIKLRFGKLDMTTDQLIANFNAAMDAIKAETRRLGMGVINRIYVSPTMGPRLEVEIA